MVKPNVYSLHEGVFIQGFSFEKTGDSWVWSVSTGIFGLFAIKMPATQIVVDSGDYIGLTPARDGRMLLIWLAQNNPAPVDIPGSLHRFYTKVAYGTYWWTPYLTSDPDLIWIRCPDLDIPQGSLKGKVMSSEIQGFVKYLGNERPEYPEESRMFFQRTSTGWQWSPPYAYYEEVGED